MHTRQQRKAVATWVASKQAHERRHGPAKPPKRRSWPIPVVTEVEPERLTPRFWRYGGTSSAKGKDGSGRSKWFARVSADKVGFREAA